MSTSKTGLFISFEGIDGCGKSTQVKKLITKLEEKKITHVLVREPGGSGISEEIREILLKKHVEKMDPRAEALLMVASRAQLTKNLIKPSIKNGTCVVADRYMDSTIAYQGGGRELDIEYLLGLNKFATYSVEPDITFFIDIDPVVCANRIKPKELDRIESAGLSFQEKVRKQYLKLADRYPDRVFKINGTDSIKNIHKEIWKKTWALLNDKN